MSIRRDNAVLTRNPVKCVVQYPGPVDERRVGALADLNQ